MTHQANNQATPRKMKTLGFGVEVEYAEISIQRMLKQIQSVVGGFETRERNSQGGYSRGIKAPDGRVWFAMRDCSIRSRNGQGAELVTPILRYSDIETLQNIVRACRNRGIRFPEGDACAEANRSCGIHIHIGAEEFDIKATKRFIKLVAKWEQVMTSALDIHNRRLEDYCKPVSQELVTKLKKVKTMDQLNIAVFNRRDWGTGRPMVHTPCQYESERYHGLNLVNLWRIGTFEGRWFNSTTHAGEVKAYIQLMLAMAERALTTTRGSAKPRPVRGGNVAWPLRMMFNRLNLRGDEFKTCRHHLAKNVEGNAWTATAAG